MSLQTIELRTVLYLDELKDTVLANGEIFAVVAQPIYNEERSCRMIELRMVNRALHGDIWHHIIMNDHEKSIPEQVERALLTVDFYKFMSWSEDKGRYYGRFFYKPGRKDSEKVILTDRRFPVLS